MDNQDYIIQPLDVGKKISEIEIPDNNEPTEDEKKIIDSLLFKGFVERKYYFTDDFPVVFRSVSGECVQRGWDILIDLYKKDMTQKEANNYVKFMNIARYLVRFGNNDFSSDDFESVDEIKKRFDFVRSLNAIIIDNLANYK